MCALQVQEDARPNIILMIADDLGWTDLSSWGSDYYRTPPLDALSKASLRFTSAYASPNCAPTRASIHTGWHPTRHGVWTVGTGNRGKASFRTLEAPPNQTHLPQTAKSLAEVLHETGYRTGHFGKWHLGSEKSKQSPLQRGFEINVGGTHLGHPKSHLAPFNTPGLLDELPGKELSDALTDHALAWFTEKSNRPSFLHLSFFAVHTPLQAHPDMLAQWESSPKGERHQNAVYAAMLASMDACVGRVVKTAKQSVRPTLVIFCSDNGGLGGYEDAGILRGAEVTHNAPLLGGKGMLHEGGVRVPLMFWQPGLWESGERKEAVALTSLFATILHSAGATLPEQPLDAPRLDPHVAGELATPWWYFPGYLQAAGNGSTMRLKPSAALLQDGWKLHWEFETGALSLFHLGNDLGESTNLADMRPKLAQAMKQELQTRIEQGTIPFPPLPLEG
ncbi:MAG: sulfatase [Planctomycetes bacterium]|nr:sulfatase [Planctomycetota bacterium]